MDQPFISICIPAYKRTEYLTRLLDSIGSQDFRDFEVILTDDSPGSDVEQLCKEYTGFNLQYFRNTSNLGTPENWNEAIRKANGKWIKLMHDDDWFSSPQSLGEFKKAIDKNPQAEFLFSAYTNIELESGVANTVELSDSKLSRLQHNPVSLFASNVIGPPSVVIHKSNSNIYYDKKLKWLVDIDFYIRYLSKTKPVYINQPLVKVGIGKEQVTQDCFRLREVEIPEAFHLLKKTGIQSLKNIHVYDAWWRLLRNLEIRKLSDISGSGFMGEVPFTVRSMVGWQKNLPLSWLRFGPFSKMIMGLHYLVHPKKSN